MEYLPKHSFRERESFIKVNRLLLEVDSLCVYSSIKSSLCTLHICLRKLIKFARENNALGPDLPLFAIIDIQLFSFL